MAKLTEVMRQKGNTRLTVKRKITVGDVDDPY